MPHLPIYIYIYEFEFWKGIHAFNCPTMYLKGKKKSKNVKK